MDGKAIAGLFSLAAGKKKTLAAHKAISDKDLAGHYIRHINHLHGVFHRDAEAPQSREFKTFARAYALSLAGRRLDECCYGAVKKKFNEDCYVYLFFELNGKGPKQSVSSMGVDQFDPAWDQFSDEEKNTLYYFALRVSMLPGERGGFGIRRVEDDDYLPEYFHNPTLLLALKPSVTKWREENIDRLHNITFGAAMNSYLAVEKKKKAIKKEKSDLKLAEYQEDGRLQIDTDLADCDASVTMKQRFEAKTMEDLKSTIIEGDQPSVNPASTTGGMTLEDVHSAHLENEPSVHMPDQTKMKTMNEKKGP